MIDKWYTRLCDHFQMKWERQGIFLLIDLSLSPLEINPVVSTTLLAFWSSNLNCFLLPKGPLTITLEDIYLLTRYSRLGNPYAIT